MPVGATAGQYETGVLTNATLHPAVLASMKAPRGIIAEAHETGIAIGRSERDASIKNCTVPSRFLRLITLVARIPGQGSWEEGGQRGPWLDRCFDYPARSEGMGRVDGAWRPLLDESVRLLEKQAITSFSVIFLEISPALSSGSVLAIR